MCILVFHSSWACWSTCCAVAQAGQAGSLQQQHWIPSGKQLSPCSKMRSRKRYISNMAVSEQGLGHPVLSPGPAWSHFVPRLASPLSVAKAVLMVFSLVREELRGV